MSHPSYEAATDAADLNRSRVQDADLVPAGVQVLVVDGDAATLAITSTILRMIGYQVLTAESIGKALTIIQERRDNLDLILTEIHLPDADKFDVLEKLGAASNLPVVIMTADNNESTMLGALLNGASLYLLKPIRKFDVKDLWQFSFMRKRDQIAQVTEDSTDQDSSEEEGDDEPESKVPAIGDKQGEARPRGQEFKEVDGDKDNADADLWIHKKTKLTWTNELQHKFLRAIQHIGIDRAQPKKILQHMNVPGLKKDNVASHLQKYRLYLKRDQDTILKTVHPESRHSSSATHLQGLLSFSELHLQATATTKDSPLPSWIRSNPRIPLLMTHVRDREPWRWSYNNQTPNPIANPLFMPSDQPSRSSSHTGIKFTGKEVVDTEKFPSIGNDSCSVAEKQSSGTGNPPPPKEAAAAGAAGGNMMFAAAKVDDGLSFQEEVGDMWW